MNTFTLKGSVVSNDSNCLVIESDDETLLSVSYFASGQIELGSRVEIEGHLAPLSSGVTAEGAVLAMADEVHVAKQLVLGGAPDDITMELNERDVTLDGE